jgi:hypothetical protein
MTSTRILIAIASLMVCAVAVASQGAPSEELPGGVALSQPGDVCDNGHTNYYWTLEDRFAGQESYRVFCGPAECGGCEGGWRPVSVTMYLYWEVSNDCALTVQAEIHEANPSGPGRHEQGRLVAVSEQKTVGPFRPAGLWAVTVAMPPDSPRVNGPCFATLRFLDTCDELPAMVAAPGACEALQSWNDRGEGWTDMRDLDLPGNLSAYASFECQLVPVEERVAWTTIKGMYETGR